MLAPNMTLDLGVREPAHNSNNSQRVEQKSSQPSSFERALERARTEKTESPKQEEQVQALETVSKTSQTTGETVETQEVAEAELPRQEIAKTGTEKTSLELELVGSQKEKDGKVLTQVLTTEADLTTELNPESLTKDVLLDKVLDKDVMGEKTQLKKDNLSVVSEAKTLVLTESLEEVAKNQLEDLEKETKDVDSKNVEAIFTQIVQNPHQGELTPVEATIAEGVVAEVKGDLRLSTGTSLDQKIQVQDFRTAAENGVTEASLKDGNFVTTVNQGEGTADITMQLTNGDASSRTSSIPAGGKETNFGAMLSNQLQNNATEFVRTGSIIMRDGNLGTINLILHPEELGNVKISLELNDRMVSAQIRVASEEAYQAFKDSISSIKQAFADSGFDTGSFDLSWSGNGQQQQGGHQNQNQNFVAFANTLYGEMMAEDSLESGVDGEILQKTYSDSSQIAVNIMA